MTTSTTRSITRKIALTLGALAVSTMTVAGAAQAKSKFSLTLNLGGWNGWGGSITTNLCDFYWHKYEVSGKFKYKKKYMQCMGYW